MSSDNQEASARPATGIISLDGLCFSYNGSGKRVLQDLTLEIPDGAITAVLGPNGSGKTTLLYVILGMLDPQAGAIHLDGRLQASLGRREMSRLMGLVPQDEHIPFEFSVHEYVLLGRAPHMSFLQTPSDDDRREAANAIELAGIYFFLFPICIRLLTTGEQGLARAWALFEGSRESDGLPFLYLFKTLVPVFAVLMLGQGLSEAIKAALRLTGRMEEAAPKSTTESAHGA